MKNLLTLLFLAPLITFSQGLGGADCASMDPICTDAGLNFTANTGLPEASTTDPGNNYDCLITQPNPTWYYFEIATNGAIDMSLSALSDIDFILWGPYSTLSQAQSDCGNLGVLPNNNVVDCSFSATNNETPSIPNAVVGEVYVMLITNYANVVQDITLTQTGGAGSTDCSIVTNPPCALTAFNVSISGCNFSTNTYDVTGSVDFTDPPVSGNLVVEDCNGNITVVASAPFGVGPLPFNLNNLPSDGLPCDVEAYFTADVLCTQQQNYVAPVCISNCPTYNLNASSPPNACGNQMYYLEIENSGCDGFVQFDVIGNYGSDWASEITWEVVSNQSGNIVASGGPGTNGGNINVTVGPLDPNVEGTIFNLIIYDSYGDGFNGFGGTIVVQIGGTNLFNPITGNFGVQANNYFSTGVNVSTSTLTVQTPSGPVVSQIGNCQDHEVGFTLNNVNFCTPVVVSLPWTIICDNSGTLIASGTHDVTVYPQIPTDDSDLVSITWNASTCQWDVSANNDCNLLDIGNLFTISPDPATLGVACSTGNQDFTVDYLGFTGGPDCCSTGGVLSNITYTNTYDVNDFIVTNGYGGTNNAAYTSMPGNGIGGNATAVTIDITGSGYCFPNVPGGNSNEFYVDIYVDGVQVALQGPLFGTSFSYSYNLADLAALGITYNENSVIEVYVLPNQFWAGNPPDYTTYVPGGNCGAMGLGDWTASSLGVNVNATYVQMAPSPASCSFLTSEPYTCCSITPLAGNPPADVIVQCVGDIPAANIADVTGVVSDCNATVSHLGDVSDGNSCPEVFTRTYRIIDDCGNFIDVIQLITVDDTVFPTGTAPGPISTSGVAPPPDVNLITDEADNCGTPTVTWESDASNGGFCPEIITRTYRITDLCGNFIELTQTITIGDAVIPTASNPATINVECIGDVPTPDPLVVTDEADNGALPPTVTWEDDTSDGLSCPETISRRYKVEDDCGNFIFVTQLIVIMDITPPTFSAPPADIIVECIGDIPAMTSLSYTDNCDAPGTVNGTDGLLTGGNCGGTIIRTWTFTDLCGNTSTVNQTITVDDNTPPTASNPTTTIVPGGPAPNVDPLVVIDEADNCGPLPTVAFVSESSDFNPCPETITRIYSVTDACGNTINVVHLILITDPFPPTASNPTSISVECIGDIPATDPLVVTDEADNGLTPTVVWEDDTSDGLTCPETITRRYRVTDDCGNFIFVSQLITILDITNPVFAAAPADIIVECIGDVPAMTNLDWTDNCDGTGSIAGSDAVIVGGNCGGTITRTWTYTDACGNNATASQIITIDDNTLPTASNPTSLNVECVGDIPPSDINVVTNAADNCTASPVIVWTGDISDGLSCPETITRTYSITDDCGNSITVDQIITVNDITPPTASNPAPISVPGALDVPVPDVNVVNNEADNCTVNPTVTWISDVSDGNVCNLEVITRTYEIMDDCGNTTTVTQDITILAVPAPIDAGIDQVICSGDFVTLTAINPLGALITWAPSPPVVDGVPFAPTQTEVYTVTADNLGCISTDDVLITVSGSSTLSFVADVLSGCEPLTVTFTNTSTGLLTDCEWSIEGGATLTGCGSVTYTFTNGGLYDVTLSSNTGCASAVTYTDFIYVEEAPIASFNLSSNELTGLNTEVIFNNTSIGTDNFVWDFGDGTATSTIVDPTHLYETGEGSYSYIVELIAYSPLGCSDTATAIIQVVEELIYYIPNTFTPDGDMHNQTFQPIFTSGFDPYDFTLLIFNRWGEVIFETHDAEQGWDGTYGGKLVSDGTYTWKVEFKTSASDERKTGTGHVNIIR